MSATDRLLAVSIEGEAGQSRTHLTCVRAAERLATDGRAGANRSHCRRATDGMQQHADPRWIEQRRMTVKTAEHEIACMRAVLATLRRVAAERCGGGRP
jgi:hypothetical protein